MLIVNPGLADPGYFRKLGYCVTVMDDNDDKAEQFRASKFPAYTACLGDSWLCPEGYDRILIREIEWHKDPEMAIHTAAHMLAPGGRIHVVFLGDPDWQDSDLLRLVVAWAGCSGLIERYRIYEPEIYLCAFLGLREHPLNRFSLRYWPGRWTHRIHSVFERG
jgi:hypothetical protein